MNDATIDRSQRLAGEVAAAEIDALLVNDPVNLRYLTNFSGSSGAALVGPGQDGMRCFFTDFRYDEQSAEEVGDVFEREIVSGELVDAVARTLGDGTGGRLGFDDGHTTVRQHTALATRLPDGWELVACGGLVALLRAVKDAGELAQIAAAAELVDGLMAWVAEHGLAGRTERDVAVELEHQMRMRGAQAPSFPTIVAAGPHGALPHAQPRDEPIPRGVLVTIDMGAQVDGYCSDCTRTFATGPIDDEAREVYELVLRAQRAAVEAIRAGAGARDVDAIARTIIADAGYGELFGHGLGHAVGLEVHDVGPRLSPNAPDVQLVAGNVVTVEPGVYLPGRFGVRIEDLVGVTAGGCDVYSGFTKELVTVG